MKLILLDSEGTVLDTVEFTREEWDNEEIDTGLLTAGRDAT